MLAEGKVQLFKIKMKTGYWMFRGLTQFLGFVTHLKKLLKI